MSNRNSRHAKAQRRQDRQRQHGVEFQTVFFGDGLGDEIAVNLPTTHPLLQAMRDNCAICNPEGAASHGH